jgi:hypothetical protein
MQAVRSNPAEAPLRGRFGRSGLHFFEVCPSAHLHECLCPTLGHAPPPCPMFRDALLFFPTVPHLTATILGCVGGFKACFLALQGVPSEGMTPLSSPPYPSCTSPVAKPCLPLFVPSRWNTFHFFVPPFATAPPPLLAPLLSSVPVSSLFSTRTPP